MRAPGTFVKAPTNLSAPVSLGAPCRPRTGGTLRLLGRTKADGTPVTPRAPSGFSLFVQEHFKATKASLTQGAPHAEARRVLRAACCVLHERSECCRRAEAEDGQRERV